MHEIIYMNPLFENIKVIAFDADDTLWSNEPYFRHAELEFERLMAPYARGVAILDELFSTEMSNMAQLGYGAKAFTISMVETAIRISNHQVPNMVITEIDLFAEMCDAFVDAFVTSALLGRSRLEEDEVCARCAVLHSESEYRKVVSARENITHEMRELNAAMRRFASGIAWEEQSCRESIVSSALCALRRK